LLTDAQDRRTYADLAARTVPPGGHLVIGSLRWMARHVAVGWMWFATKPTRSRGNWIQHSGDSHAQPGVGLGLTIASQAAGHLHGKLSVASKVSVGSVFSLTVPA